MVNATDSETAVNGRALRVWDPPRLLGGEVQIARDLDGAEWLVLPPEHARENVPGPQSPLLYALAAVETVPDARAFVRDYGLLFTGPSVGGEIREAWDAWRREVGRINSVAGLAVDARRAMAGDIGAVADLRRGLAGQFDLPDDDLVLLTDLTDFISTMVNNRLSENTWAVDPGPRVGGQPATFVFAARPPHALAYAYFQLADLLVARAPLDRCAGCGRLFVRKRSDHVYHDDACRQRAQYQKSKRRNEGSA